MTTITLPRAVIEQALEFVTSERWGTTPYMDVCVYEDAARLREALRAALAQQAEPESCAWHQDGDSESDLYATSCRHYFSLNDGTPEDNKMHWCCYCGKRLVQLLTEDDDDERS